MPDSYRELYTKPAATNASNINGGSSESRLFQRTNGNWNSSTKVFTATGDTLDSAWVGHLACVCTDGTTTGAYFAEVTAIDDAAKTITLSATRTLGSAPSTSATARTITIGGAWTGMSGATTFPFSIATWSSVTNASEDRVRINLCGAFEVTTTATSTAKGIVFEGYSATAGDGGFATIDYTGSGTGSPTLQVGGGGGFIELRSLWIKNNTTGISPAAAHGLTISTSSGVGSCVVKKCRFSDIANTGVNVSSSTSVNFASFDGCEFFDCCNSGANGQAIFFNGDTHGIVSNCIFHDMGSTVITCINTVNGHVSVSDCVFDSNQIAFDDSTPISPRNCVFYNNGTAFKVTSGSSLFGIHAIGCIFENNTTAISRGNTNADRQPMFEQCVFYNNTTKLDSNATGRVVLVNCIDATRSTMVDPANGDFRTKETNLRGAINGTLLQSSGSYSKTTTRRTDIGIGPSNPHYNGQ